MIATDEDALFADFVETYHVSDWRAFPVKQAAALAFHLPPDSRIKRKMSGRTWGMDTLLLATIADRLGTIAWMFSKDGEKGRNRPDSIVEMLSGDGMKKNAGGTSLQTFASGDDFAERWRKMTQQQKGG